MWYFFFTAVGSFRIPVWQPDSIETGATAALPTFNYDRDILARKPSSGSSMTSVPPAFPPIPILSIRHLLLIFAATSRSTATTSTRMPWG
jgi:hypothetical protein